MVLPLLKEVLHGHELVWGHQLVWVQVVVHSSPLELMRQGRPVAVPAVDAGDGSNQQDD